MVKVRAAALADGHAGLRDRITAKVKRRPHVHRRARALRTMLGRVVPPRRYPGIPGGVHFNDFMLDDRSPPGVASYRARAQNVIDEIDATLRVAGRSFEDVGRWLDFGSGYGRVIRFLVERVPRDRVVACDVVREGVDFCSAEFGVRALYSTADLTRLRLGAFDFVYAVSVLSHLNERNSRALLRVLGESLVPDGILLVTTHGRWSVEHPETYGEEYVVRAEEIRDETERHGMHFLPYLYTSGDAYGMAWHTKEWVVETMRELHRGELELLRFAPHGLDGHQDVFAFRRTGAERTT